ncbi:hypothetical protein THASP1DRAFT_28179 [Thamnocephalis sphaerospora]|uniref:Uncharacterized protein n=1 Tax=Thamnocephalis sphaerospora TaxID=78915 RepID=A0A4P9XUW8_9FUNG|nr:hypothetical protein THASP1DRAFT_28179 [Thamnocephalis sphaerospora]|eukprot:RKP10028.1 hypothetical protein THASP1DRAFT_28179 [Thamnocephalis sphaerospora]
MSDRISPVMDGTACGHEHSVAAQRPDILQNAELPHKCARNPSPPPGYELAPNAGAVTAESLLLAVIRELDALPTSPPLAAPADAFDDTPLDASLAAVWDAAGLASYATRLVKCGAHRLLLKVILMAACPTTAVVPRDATASSNGSGDNDGSEGAADRCVGMTNATERRGRTLELAFGALANLASWRMPARTLLTDADVRQCTLTMLARCQDAFALTEVCRLLDGLLVHLEAMDEPQQTEDASPHAAYRYALEGWSAPVRLTELIRCTCHAPLKQAALAALRGCTRVLEANTLDA